MTLLTAARLRRFAPHARADIVAELCAAEDDGRLESVGLNSPLRLQHFLAQVSVESAGLSRIEESLNYSAARLRQVFPRYFKTAAVATANAGNPRAIANRVYGGRLGNTGPDDGWRYRGGGLLQTTGRDNYREAGHEDDPDALRQSGPALAAALAFWDRHGCNRYADRDDCTGLSIRVNGGTNGLADRKAALRKAKAIFASDAVEDAPVGLMGDVDAAVAAVPSAATPITDPASVRHVQQLLRDKGYIEVGLINGEFGSRTQAAVMAFRNDNGLPLTPTIDAGLLVALAAAEPREISDERAASKPEGSRIVKNANTLTGVSAATGGASLFAEFSSNVDPSGWLDKLEGWHSLADRARALAKPLLPFVTVPNVLIVMALLVGFIAWRIRAARIEDHRTGAAP